MLWLRQMGMAAVAVAIAGLVFGFPIAAAQLVAGPVELPQGPMSGALQVAGVIVGLVVVRRVYLALERRDAPRSGRPPQG